jgi:transcriptional regulator with XRE-family HTH domain
MLNYESSPAFSKLGAIVGFLGLTERALSVELGMTRNAVRALLRGELAPSYDEALRIQALSFRAPLGQIWPDAWPKPVKVAPTEKKQTARKGK